MDLWDVVKVDGQVGLGGAVRCFKGHFEDLTLSCTKKQGILYKGFEVLLECLNNDITTCISGFELFYLLQKGVYLVYERG